ACTNGVIHVIDSVIMPETRDILTVASEAGSFNTLAAAINAAGLTEVLQGDGPFTVFAPTDTAFAKLPPGTVEHLLKPENRETLRAVLLYHVVPGRVFADQAMKAHGAETVQGSEVTLRAAAGTVIVDNAAVTQADIEARNGVIHVIDTVIMPN
ncbi:MAG: fasciclin domain-containing protein, partial [Phycisphaerales bacterium]|nr:fasciclin domain-containing protein [Phycisphaerales bacterium]